MPDLSEEGTNHDPGDSDTSMISSTMGAPMEKKEDKKKKYRKAKLDKLAAFARRAIANA